ncbi:21097_t:CDS:2 [Cetraspora pellucida]|uniref:21097_t:CDS:1 n=1 Tax=Cetraspora pellucida TaxID=1433469 RepID=A0A9N9D6V1_9GLOM|nr:21097_t:CDS:2 [Cetraspora pellucida]
MFGSEYGSYGAVSDDAIYVKTCDGGDTPLDGGLDGGLEGGLDGGLDGGC